MPLFEKDGQRIFYVHVPRTGGVYITKCFTDHGWALEGHNCIVPTLSNSIKTQHYHSELYKKWLKTKTIDFYFMSVRNPYTKFMSDILYMHNQDSSLGSLYRSIGFMHTGFWLGLDEKSIYEIIKWLIDFNMEKFDNHYRHQVDFFSTLIDGVVKQETLITDLNLLDLDVNFPNKNLQVSKSGRNDRLQKVKYKLLTEESKELIYDTYKEDFEKFGYDKDF